MSTNENKTGAAGADKAGNADFNKAGNADFNKAGNAGGADEWYTLHTRAGYQFMPSSIDKQRALLDRIAQDPMRGTFERILRERDGKARLDPESFYRAVLDIASSADVTAAHPVLFSTFPENQLRAEAFVNKNAETDIIYTTPGGWFLERLELFNKDISPIDAELAHLAGYVMSIRFLLETQSEEITAFVDGAESFSTFRMVELAGIAANPNIKKVNGRPKEDFNKAATLGHLTGWMEDFTRTANVNYSPLPGTLADKFNAKSIGYPPLPADKKDRMRDMAIKNYLTPLLSRLIPA